MTEIKKELDGKRILIWGYGREGKATEAFLKTHCPNSVYEIYEGSLEGINEENWDFIIKSPGIVMLEERRKFTSETELFLNQFGDRTIGITGTKGKSTTSSLMYAALKACGKKCLLLGNIGEPCFNYIDEIDDETYVVFELSAHQLLHITRAPRWGMFLNLFPEHLDYYGTVENYFNAKANIAKKQEKGDVVLLGENVPEISGVSTQRTVKAPLHRANLRIPGEHNVLNAEFVRTMAADILGLPEDRVISGMETFEGLPHRLQFVGEKDGVKFFDDSISTIPEAAINAATCIPDVSVVLVGGMDRGIEYEKLEHFIDERREYHFILMYDTGKRIAKEMKEANLSGNFEVVDDLKEAIEAAKAYAPVGSAVVLSPAAASYGFFKNFEERGDKFKELAGL